MVVNSVLIRPTGSPISINLHMPRIQSTELLDPWIDRVGNSRTRSNKDFIAIQKENSVHRRLRAIGTR
jgi:hypothetical protein